MHVGNRNGFDENSQLTDVKEGVILKKTKKWFKKANFLNCQTITCKNGSGNSLKSSVSEG
jgi:hypothetical protein